MLTWREERRLEARKGSEVGGRGEVPDKHASNGALEAVVRDELQDVVEHARRRQRSLYGPFRSLSAVVRQPGGRAEAVGGGREFSGGLAAVDGGDDRCLAQSLRFRDGPGRARPALGTNVRRGSEADVPGR